MPETSIDLDKPGGDALLCVRCRDRARMSWTIVCQECSDELDHMTPEEMAQDAQQSAERTAFRIFVIDPMTSPIGLVGWDDDER